MKLAEMYKIVPIASDMDVTDTATNPCDSINMKGYHHATFLVNFQDLGVAALYCTAWSGAADGDQTSALTFKYAFMSAAALATGADVLTAEAESGAGLVIAHATYDNYMLVIEVDASAMDIANGEEWLTLTFPDTATNATGNLSVVAILEPRYTGNLSLTALA